MPSPQLKFALGSVPVAMNCSAPDESSMYTSSYIPVSITLHRGSVVPCQMLGRPLGAVEDEVEGVGSASVCKPMSVDSE